MVDAGLREWNRRPLVRHVVQVARSWIATRHSRHNM
jgi:hypothetical protein